MRIHALVLLALSPLAAFAQAPLPRTHAPQPTTGAITPGDLMTRLYIIADDSMMGRQAGTAGNLMVTAYIAAEAKKMGDTLEFKRKLAFNREKLLMEQLLQKAGKEALTDKAMHDVYDEAAKQMGQEQEVHARHILIRAAAGDDKASKEAEDKIKAIIVRLKKGEDFAKVASEATEDPSGKANGGDLGYFSKEQMVPEFSDTAFKLDKGQISEPVKTQFGWHVIKVEDKRVKPVPPFDEVKPQIENYVQRKAQAEMVTSLRASAKIEKMYKPDEPAAPAAPDKK